MCAQAIGAFEEAVLGMRAGGVRRIEVPGAVPSLGYARDRKQRFSSELLSSDMQLYKYRTGPQPSELGGQRALDFVLVRLCSYVAWPRCTDGHIWVNYCCCIGIGLHPTASFYGGARGGIHASFDRISVICQCWVLQDNPTLRDFNRNLVFDIKLLAVRPAKG